MQLSQIVTLLGLCLSQASALSVPTSADEAAIKSFVGLVTQPESALENSPGFSRIASSIQDQHNLDHTKFHQDLIATINPLFEATDRHTPYIFDSYLGFRRTMDNVQLGKTHPELKAQRLQIYRDALYSELIHLAQNKPATLNAETLQKAHNSLLRLITNNANTRHSDSPTQAQHILKEIQSNFDKSLTSKVPMEFNKLSRAQINQKLAATNVPGAPKVSPITGQLAKQLFTTQFHHMAHEHQVHALHPTAKPAAVVA